jgi:hypothetical protein
LILGLPWLQLYNPHIDWGQLTINFLEERYPVQASLRTRTRTRKRPLRKRPIYVKVACCYRLKIKDRLTFQIPLEYKEFAELFKEELDEDSLPLYKL